MSLVLCAGLLRHIWIDIQVRINLPIFLVQHKNGKWKSDFYPDFNYWTSLTQRTRIIGTVRGSILVRKTVDRLQSNFR